MTTISMSDPAHLAVVLPYLFGYQPRASLIVVAKHGKRLGAMARVDLPAPTSPGEAQALLGRLCRQRPDEVLVVAYEESADSSALARACVRSAAASAGYAVGEEFVVRDGRVWCRDPRCPADGHPLPRPADVPMVAELVALGMAPLDSRDAVEARLRPGHDAVLAPGSALIPHSGRRVAWRTILRSATRDDGPVDDRVATHAVGSLLDRDWRDGLIAWMCPGFLPLDALGVQTRRDLARVARGSGLPAAQLPSTHDEAVLAALCELSRRTPDDAGPAAAAIVTLAGTLAWAMGDGTLAAIAFDRALAADPTYRLAALLSTSLDQGMPPPQVRHRTPVPRVAAQGLDSA